MKKLIFLIISIISFSLNAQDLEKKLSIADSLKKNKNYFELVSLYENIAEDVYVKGLYYHKIYKCYAELHDTINLKIYIFKTLDYSPEYYQLLNKDSVYLNMPTLFKAEVYKSYITSMKKHHRPLNIDDSISLLLKKLVVNDQFYRKQISQFDSLSKTNYKLFKIKFDSLMTKQKVLDMSNTLSVDSLIKIGGWPDRKKLDIEGLKNVFHIVQHCPVLKKRKHFLKLMKKSTNENNGSYYHYAFYVDRYLMLKQKKQIYGTQYTLNSNVGMKLYRTFDIKNLNNRRIKFGLEVIKINK